MTFYLLLVMTIAWFCFMTWLSHQSGEGTRRTSEELAEGLFRLDRLWRRLGITSREKLNYRLRSLAHCVVFLVLTVLVLLTVQAGGGRPFAAVPFLLFWCWGDEASKPLTVRLGLTSGRHFSWADVGLNAAGAAAAVAGYYAVAALTG